MEVNDENTWAHDVVAYLERHRDLFVAWEEGHEQVAPHDYDRAILGLREVLNPYELHGYHCTRLMEQEINFILENGMQLPNGNVLRERIMAAHHAGLFDAEVARRLIQRNNADDENRANKIWFCFFPPHIAGESGIKSLLGLWGGEALYRSHRNDPEIGPILSKIGVPCLVEADVVIGSLRRYSFLDVKIMRQFLFNRGLRGRESLEHEDYAASPVPAAKIRRMIRYGERDFEKLTRSKRWRKPRF
jgi:hypothetical protein